MANKYVAIIDGMTSCKAEDLMQPVASFISQEGVYITDGTDLQVQESDTPALTVKVNAGSCFIKRDAYVNNDGTIKFWHFVIDDTEDVGIDSNSSGSTRIDALCVKIDTSASPDASGSNVGTLIAVKGTPGSGVPTIPDNHLKLAEVTIENGESTLLNADITDSRTFIGIQLPYGTEGYRLQDTGGSKDAQLYEDSDGKVVLTGNKSGGGIRIDQENNKVESRSSSSSSWSEIGSGDGWISTSDSWSYSSWDADVNTGVITVPSGATSTYSAGMRIKITQPTDGVKYGIITKVTSTLLTAYFGTEYDLNNEAISSPNYSLQKAPFGFPCEKDKWQQRLVDTTARSESSPTASTWYNTGSLSIDMPIGNWDIKAKWLSTIVDNGAQNAIIQSSLSTSSSSVSDSDLSSRMGHDLNTSDSDRHYAGFTFIKNITATSKTTYYPINMTPESGVNNMNFDNNVASLMVEFTCAYL